MSGDSGQPAELLRLGRALVPDVGGQVRVLNERFYSV
jgi:hypothetical protein